MKQFLPTFLRKYRTSRLVLAFIIFWTPVLLFAKLANEVVENEPIALDTAILQWLHAQSSPALEAIFFFFTTLGNVEFILPIALLIFGILIYKKQRINALLFAFGVGGAALANFILKLIFQRDRPSFWESIVIEHGYSFPSGHAMVSSALVLSLIVILWNTRWRIPAIIIGGFIALMIATSRLYFGVHYPTDIIAGWSVSIIWVSIVTLVAKNIISKRSAQLKPNA